MTRTLAEVEQGIRNATGDAGDDRPEIIITGRHLRDITSDALDVLNGEELYTRGELVVRINHGAAERLTNASLKGILERAASFVKETNRDGVSVTAPARVPGDVPADILSLPEHELPFPRLQAIATTPVLLPSGELLMRDGYDPQTGILLRLRGLTDLRHDLTIEQALASLDDLLGDFPFTDEAGRAHSLAMLLQPVVRHVIRGATPLYLVDAPLRGNGKGLLIDVCTIIPTGRTAPIMPLTRDGEELDKRITTLLVDGSTHVLLDNVTQVRSAVLAAALTSEVWRGRILGKSEMVHANNHAVWIASGNNVELSDEIARRTMPIRLDAGVERPEERHAFRHPKLKEWTHGNRSHLLSALLSLVRAWADEGMPRGEASIGSFESWAGVMSGILNVAGVPGLLGGREMLHSHSDRETSEWSAFVQAWRERYEWHPVTARDLFDVLKERGLLLELWGGRKDISALQRLGHALKARRDRVYGDLRIRPAGQDAATRNAAYRLEPTASSEGGTKHPKHPQTPGSPSSTHVDAGCFDGAESRNTRNTRPSTQNTRSENTVQNGTSTTTPGVSGVSGVLKSPPAKVTSDDLTARVAKLAGTYAPLTIEQRRERYAAIRPDAPANTPDWWANLLPHRTDSLRALIALELLTQDHHADPQAELRPHVYFKAAGEAGANLTPTPAGTSMHPPGAPPAMNSAPAGGHPRG